MPYGDRTDAELYGFLHDNFALARSARRRCGRDGLQHVVRGRRPARRFPRDGPAGTRPHRQRGGGAARSGFAARSRFSPPRRRCAARAYRTRDRGCGAPDRRRGDRSAGIGAARRRRSGRERDRRATPCARSVARSRRALKQSSTAARITRCSTRISPASCRPKSSASTRRCAQAAAAGVLVRRLALPPGASRTHYLTNGDLDGFESNVRAWTGDRTGIVAAVPALAHESPR